MPISKDELTECAERGLSWDDIAEELGYSSSYIRNRASVFGLTRKRARAQHTPPVFEGDPVAEPSLEELFDLARKSASVINRVDPVITSKTISLNVQDPVGIIFVSCAHLGGRYTFYEAFESIFKQVLDIPRLYWVSLGDDIEGFAPGFKDGEAVVSQAIADPKVQRRMLAHVLQKLVDKGKLLAGCASQHGGDWTRKATGDDPIKELYLERDIPYFDGKALVTLVVGKQRYHIALAHEFPGSSQLNPNYAQRRAALFDFPSADVVVQGDKHRYAVTEYSLPPAEFDAGLRDSYMQTLVQVGTAKAGPDKYSIRGWSRGVLEWPVLIFRPDRNQVVTTRDLGLAKLILSDWR